MGLQPSSRALYANCTVYPPDKDEIIFMCDAGRMDFYLSNGLAEILQDTPPIIRLKFTPKGPGHAGDPFFLQKRLNLCVVCGSTSGLSRHHVVPDAYRRHFPRDRQRNWSYDVMALCVDCHARYEDSATELRKTISFEYGVPESGWPGLNLDQVRFVKACAALKRHRFRMPEDRLMILEGVVRSYLGIDRQPTDDDLAVGAELSKTTKPISAAEIIVPKIADIDEFAKRWRLHFLSAMKPKFMPVNWDVSRRIYSEPDRHANSPQS